MKRIGYHSVKEQDKAERHKCSVQLQSAFHTPLFANQLADYTTAAATHHILSWRGSRMSNLTKRNGSFPLLLPGSFQRLRGAPGGGSSGAGNIRLL
ncbi:uncharacterized protein LOC144115479 isoform X3 [Amblyomma americanum]